MLKVSNWIWKVQVQNLSSVTGGGSRNLGKGGLYLRSLKGSSPVGSKPTSSLVEINRMPRAKDVPDPKIRQVTERRRGILRMRGIRKMGLPRVFRPRLTDRLGGRYT